MLYYLENKYWQGVKHQYKDTKADYIKNHGEAMWVRWPVIHMVSYRIDTLKFDNDSILIKATTKNYFEAYHLFTFWDRDKDTMIHEFIYSNSKWYLTHLDESDSTEKNIDYDTLTVEELDSLVKIDLAPFTKSK